ncbi:MAG TPA: class I SAM-dependent methyltransferase [Alphaproteobacteria bacterium]|nr:class I SAM-dependent methyltransferase [Alphaproteobacteria bacterium]
MKPKFSKDEIYDRLVPALCPPYTHALEYFKGRTAGAEFVVELGVGTGNIAKAILSATPTIKYIGLDTSAESLEKARQKLQGYTCELRQEDFSKALLPNAQIYVSSLSSHHLDHEQQNILFRRIHQVCPSFLHFELIAPQSKKEEEENNAYLKSCASKVAGELGLSSSDIEAMLEESNKHDKPMTLAEHIIQHKSHGVEFDLLLKDHCFVMYQTLRK